MGLTINTNVSALNAQNNLRRSKESLDSAFEKISTGQRINKSADDAAGLAMSENLKGQIRSLGQATRNANDGISFVQVAEGSLNEVSNILTRLRELSVQASSDTIGNKEREYVDVEVQQLKDEVQRIASVTKFNNVKMLNGEAPEVELQVGTGNDPFEDRLKLNLAENNVTLSNLGIDGISFKEKSGAQEAIGSIDNAINIVNSNRANLGATQNRLLSTVNNLQASTENLSAANSRVRDADIAREVSEMVRSNVLQQSGVAVLAQANNSPKVALGLLM